MMAIPSSPLELPSSPPPLPPSAFVPLVHNIRKRQLAEDDSSLSSDPLFSEEPSEAEDSAVYSGQRRKKMIRGPWWIAGSSQSQANVKKENAVEEGEVARNMDSGVFMGSDLSSDNDPALPDQRRRPHLRSFGNRPYQATTRPILDQVQPLAAEIIDRVIEAGKETFDLSDLGLTTLSAATLSPIRHNIRQLHNDLTCAPPEDVYRPFQPETKLFLAHNRLSRLPPEVCQIEHLIALSLRNNELTELHPNIGRLHRLKELNVAGNMITYLPWQLLDFMVCRESHRQIILRPNPLMQPVEITGQSALVGMVRPDAALQKQLQETDDAVVAFSLLKSHYEQQGGLNLRCELELRFSIGRAMRARHLQQRCMQSEAGKGCREELVYLASSQVRYFDITGATCQKLPADWNFPVDLGVDSTAIAQQEVSRTPSLFELVLQVAQKHCYLNALPQGLPDVISSALRLAAEAIPHGNWTCSTCGRDFIVPRAEWIEFWFNGSVSERELTQDSVLPFKRQVCSWHCVQPTQIGGYRC